MIYGTTNDSQPRNAHLGLKNLYAVSGPCCERLPMATSVISSVKPNVTANNMYISRKSPPPSRAARYGKRQILPKPTAEPAAASTKPSEPLKEFLFFLFIIYCYCSRFEGRYNTILTR